MDTLNRSDVLREFSGLIMSSIVVAPLGNTVRELYAIADQPANFYLLGSMGMAIPVGLGLALGQPETVIAFEGDGGCLMNLGALATVARYAPPNLRVVVFDNGAYESTGGQPSHSRVVASLRTVAEGCGIRETREVITAAELARLVAWLAQPGLRLAVVRTGMAEKSFPRVPIEPPEIFARLRRHLAANANYHHSKAEGLTRACDR
jgi:sulfopyruvate decarboxylase subunit beta